MARAGWSKSRMAGMWGLEAERQAPAMKYWQWLIDIAMNPDKYPEFMKNYLGTIMPKIGEWATAGGVYNPAAVSRKASENLFPYLMSLGQQGAAGMAGTPLPALGQPGPSGIEIWGPMLGAAGGAAASTAGSIAGSYFGSKAKKGTKID